MSLNHLEDLVIAWAAERDLLHSKNQDKQALKMVEEVGEVCRGVLKHKDDEVVDGIGDVCVTLIILAHQFGYDLEYCLQTAYDVIKDRKGRTLDGAFIKSEDL